MNTIPTRSDAVTGLQRITAIPLPCIEALIRDHDGTGKVYLKSDSQVIDIPIFNEEAFHYQETSSNEEGGKVYNVSIVGSIMQESEDNRGYIQKLEDGRWLVVATSCDGTVRCFGTTEFPLMFVCERDSSKPYLPFQFVGMGLSPSFIVVNDI